MVIPPKALLTPCQRPSTYKLETNEDLARFASSVILSWESCAAQIDAIREFFKIDDEQDAMD